MKHVHHDLIVEWAKDTSKQFQVKIKIKQNSGWFDATAPNWDPDLEYRIKPRELTEGHWYPCIDSTGERSIYYYDGSDFCIADGDSYGCEEVDSMKWIGESLGPIQFGEGK